MAAGMTPITIAMMLTRLSGWRQPKVPPRTSSSNEATTQPAAMASPTATGTSMMPGSGIRSGNDAPSSSAASHAKTTTSSAARTAHPKRHPRPTSTAPTTGTYRARLRMTPRALPTSKLASSTTE
jgi:hypothetical protein